VLAHGDLVRGHVYQFGAARRGDGALRGADEVMMLAPSGNQHADQVDIQGTDGN
jgi:hypothetical protein